MCGIAGVIGVRDGALGKGMIDRIAHRGPDDEGVWISGPEAQTAVTLASRRLAILDLSPAGHMPMLSEDGRYAIVFNGEIYNFHEIRAELEAYGARFRSRGDTEVVLAAYQRWGRACLDRFNGMFALAIWDGPHETLFLARDRIGEKPLYYAEERGRFYFGSEIKSFFAPGGMQARLDPSGIAPFLKTQFTPGDATMFAGVKRLAPAHWLTLKAGRVEIGRYWRPDARSDAPSQEEIRGLIEQAVRSRLISDVPVGLFLSGGVDSGVVAACAAGDLPQAIAYTLKFEGQSGKYDESALASATAQRLGLTDRIIECSEAEAVAAMPKLAWHMDEPIADSLMFPFYALCRQARGAFTVALSGEGADEIFGGYRFYTLEPIRARLAASPFAPLLGAVRGGARSFGLGDRLRLRALAQAASRDPVAGFMAWQGSFFSDAEIAGLAPDAPKPDEESLIAAYRARSPGLEGRADLAKAPYLDLNNRLPDYILAVRDRMSMASSLELRTPFHDHRLVEAACALGPERMIDGDTTKLALRIAAREKLGDLASARRKVPFSAPVRAWGRALAAQHLREGSYLVGAGILDRRAVDRLIEGVDRRAQKLWSVIVLELWAKAFLQG